MFDLQTCARKNILQLKPYRCARDDFKDDGTNILLDANENSIGPGLDPSAGSCSQLGELIEGLNRYPDPHQIELKQLFCNLRNSQAAATADPDAKSPLTPDHMFVGVGSDEAIDAIIRCFCHPGGTDKILICPPTYGMYSVSADINNVPVLSVPLLPAEQSFQVDVPAVEAALSDEVKLIFICSPGNPTGSRIPRATIEHFLNPKSSAAVARWNGVVVVDEAYIDFSPPRSSACVLVPSHPNLVVMQTMSKAFGLAGLRIGAAFTSPAIAGLLNSLKAPYNISSPTSALARAALGDPVHMAVSDAQRAELIRQRDLLVRDLGSINGVGRIRGGLDSNFVLVEMLNSRNVNGPEYAKMVEEQRGAGASACQIGPSNEVAQRVYLRMATAKGVVVRFRGSEHGCFGCLRITVGTEEQRKRLIAVLDATLEEVVAELAKQ